ncbi:MAG: DUF423 domain-containing protein [Bacteroidetes bacterium]|nr:MAG: DUF423 domain-containing protein [Bacteroidota bacterium]
MYRRFLQIGTISGALAVIIGAFGAHTLKPMMSPDTINTFETGVRYQFYHTFALLLAAILYRRSPFKSLEWAGIFFISGIILFSGSLYALSILDISGAVGLGGIGAITPLGGACFIAGWISLFMGVRKSSHGSRNSSGNQKSE